FEAAADDGALGIFPNRVDGQGPVLGSQATGVADLPARLDIEWVLLQEQLDARSLLPESEDIGIGFGGLIADELLFATLDAPPLPGFRPVNRRSPAWRNLGSGSRGDSSIARALPLLLQRLLEPGQINVHAPLSRDDLGEVDGETERVVELEGVRTG